MELESIRRSYRPNRITVLFVGESPPHGGTFFYCGNSRLFNYTVEAFRRALWSDIGDEHFLSTFMRAGCYLEDLSPAPINHLSKPERGKARRAAVGQFRERAKAASPESVVCVMKGIAKLVREAIKEAGLATVPFEAVSFPAMGHEQEYVAELSPILRRLAAAPAGKRLPKMQARPAAGRSARGR